MSIVADERPAIAVIGAGPGGLIAAVMLHKAGWPVRVFESDGSAMARDQGGTLDPHPESGQVALRKAGLWEAFSEQARHDDQGQRVVDFATGEVLAEQIPAPGEGDRPEIDRAILREILLAPLGSDVVRWGRPIRSLIEGGDGTYRLEFDDGVSEPFGGVIGADGAWSRVRPVLTDAKPGYTGVTFVEVWLSNVDDRHPASSALVGHGTMFAVHGGSGLIAQRNGNAMIRVYAAFQTEPELGDRPERALAGITKDELLVRFRGWAPALLDLVRDADRIAAVRPIVALPAGMAWRDKPGLAVIGDAAHVMPPLGVGVNLAMLDASELAEAMIQATDWRAAMSVAQQRIHERGAQEAVEVAEGFGRLFSDEGTEMLGGLMQAPEGDAPDPST